ncbi:MAG: hypothetical protein JWM41_3973 [Gemmatimonadetes bacterium]|nr:hypothetical protein [Gemmatimonadota bacterium]
MILGSLLITLMLQATPSADSTTDLPWYRHEPSVDARLMPDLGSAPAADTVRRRPRAVSYSDWYYRRLQIHRWGSYVELPLFAGEYWLGNKLISRTETPGSWVKPTHAGVAGALGALFAVNTVTGVWNLYESRQSTDDRALVWSHSALMLASDAGFAITGLLAGDAHNTTRGADRHRNAALVSMGLATAGTALMWLKRGF